MLLDQEIPIYSRLTTSDLPVNPTPSV